MPSLLIAFAAVIGVGIGRVAQTLLSALGQTRVSALRLGIAIAVPLAIWLFLATRSPYALLPPAGLLFGVLYRKPELISLSSGHGGNDPHGRA